MPSRFHLTTWAREGIVRLHAPSRWWFTVSLIVAIIAVFGALTPIPYLSVDAVWVAILGYVLLAVANLAEN
jgi:hypothetical protein